MLRDTGGNEDKLDRFTDRHELIRLFLSYLNDGDEPSGRPPTRVIFLHGEGGNGKTLLLDYLRERCCFRMEPGPWREVCEAPDDDLLRQVAATKVRQAIPQARLLFDLQPSGDSRPQEAWSALAMIYRQLLGTWPEGSPLPLMPVFRFAYAHYLLKSGQLTETRLRNLFPDGAAEVLGKLGEALAAGVSAIGTVRPLLRLLVPSEEAEVRRLKRHLDEQAREEIERADPERDLLPRLPEMLARGIAREMERPGAPPRLVLFLDTHDALLMGSQKESTHGYFQRDEWLRLLLKTLLAESRGVLCLVTGRTPPRWSELGATYRLEETEVEIRRLGHLTPEDAFRYLREPRPDVDPALHPILVEYATATPGEVHPAYLGLCRDIVLEAARRGRRLRAEDFVAAMADKEPRAREVQLVNLLLREASGDTERAIIALSACRAFSREIYHELRSALGFQGPAFEDVLGYSFVWRARDTEGEWYRVHDLVRRLAPRDSRRQSIVREAHRLLEQRYREAAKRNPPDIIEAIYHRDKLDPAAAAEEWCDLFEDALRSSGFAVCAALVALRGELTVPEGLPQGHVFRLVGNYCAALARHDQAFEEYGQAIAAYDQALRLAPDDPATHGNKGNALALLADLQARLARPEEALKGYGEAIAAHDQALRLAPDNPTAHSNKGLALASLADLLAQFARHEEALKGYGEAIATYDEALRLAPDNPTTHSNKGLALQSLADLQAQLARHEKALKGYGEAIAAYDQALRLAPDDPATLSNKGNALKNRADLQARLARHEKALKGYAEAIAAYEQALRLAPDDPRVHSNKGLALASLADLLARLARHEEALKGYAEAIAAYEQALSLAPDDPRVHSNKGTALASLADLLARLARHEEALTGYAEAIAAFDQALRLAPDDPRVHSNKGLALASLADLLARLARHEEALKGYAEAIAAYDQALSLAPDDPRVHSNKGTALASLADLQARLARHEEALESYGEAIATLRMACRLAPGQASSHVGLGLACATRAMLLIQVGRLEEAPSCRAEAVRAFEEALRLAPDDPWCPSIRDLLEGLRKP